MVNYVSAHRKYNPFYKMDKQYSELNRKYFEKADEYYDSSRSEMLSFVPNEATSVLDIGCGSGNFGEIVNQARNCRVWGIEPSPQSAEKAEQRLDKVINTIFSPDIPELQNERFDVICFNDVLEHLIEPEEILIQCKKVKNFWQTAVAWSPQFQIFCFFRCCKIF